VVKLSGEYKLVDSLAQLGAVPSLVDADSLTIAGKVTFEQGVAVQGLAEFTDDGLVAAGTYGS
jgi:hypothetical protein